jgi:hypothetical protein
MSIFLDELATRGVGLLPGAVELSTVERLRALCRDALSDSADNRRTRSSRGHVYAARNLLDAIPEVKSFWRGGVIGETLRQVLGARLAQGHGDRRLRPCPAIRTFFAADG